MPAPEFRGFHTRFGRRALLALLTMSLIPVLTRALSGADARRLQASPRSDLSGFTLSDIDGHAVGLNETAGDIILVHFFATWCEPCREEFASLAHLSKHLGPGRVAMLAINVAEVPARVRRFLEGTPAPFPVLLDADRAVTKAWGVTVLPTTYVLDHTRTARLFVQGDLDWMHPDVLAALDGVTRGDAAKTEVRPVQPSNPERGNP